MNSNDRLLKGLELRREVVGEARVNSCLTQADDFSKPLQELMTSFAWGEVWSRSFGLSRHSKSIATLSMLIAQNRPDEFEVHVRGAINNGVSKDEIRELIIHSCIYCGFPAALQAVRIAQKVFDLSETTGEGARRE